jgi:hypothetical protein
MTSNHPDPVTRWATEHYGFPDEPTAEANAENSHFTSPPSAAVQAAAGPGTGARGRVPLRWAGGLLSLALVVGVGAFAVAADGSDTGSASGASIVVTRLDADAGPRAGHPHGDHR